MRIKKLNLSLLILMILAISGLKAQNVIPVSGGNATGSGGTASYTVGQMVYTTNTGTNGSVAQGVQQAFEISEITAIEGAEGISLSVMAYPNPTTDYLTLGINEFEISNLSYQLYDMQGKIIRNAKITEKLTSIVMSNLASATYLLKVMEGKKEVKTFKIIKN